MGTDVTGKKKRGSAPEPAEGAELRLVGGFELDDETLEALVVGGDGPTDYVCNHNWVYSHREEGMTWGYTDIYRCTKCGTVKAEWV